MLLPAEVAALCKGEAAELQLLVSDIALIYFCKWSMMMMDDETVSGRVTNVKGYCSKVGKKQDGPCTFSQE